MNIGGWLDLHEFSKKYGVSLSTLRRRIRAKSIVYKLERGRYWLSDTEETMNAAPLFSRIQDLSIPEQTIKATLSNQMSSEAMDRLSRLELENRKLKAQIAELNTLVGVLEAELSQKEMAPGPTRSAEFSL